VISYERKFDDGRIAYPLILIDWIPAGSETGSLALHAGAFPSFQQIAGVSKVIEVRDGSEELTKDFIDAKLAAR